jgi:tetratricopeptide (TPR) repeat protein
MSGRAFFAALVLGLVAVVWVGAAHGEIIRLRDGSFLQGKVVDSDKKFVTFKRWDTGGVVRLSWMQLIEEDHLRLGRMLGLIVTEDKLAVKVDGIRFHLKTGEIIEGVLVKEQGTATELAILTSPGKPFKYPKSIIRSQEPIKIDILRVYSEEGAYMLKVKADGEPTDSPGHMATADYCQRIGYFEKEKDHLEKALAMGGGDESQQEYIQNRLEALVELIKEREVLLRIKAINRLIANKKFSEAAEAWQAMGTEFPQSKVVTEDSEKVADRIVREKENYLRSVVVRGWFAYMRQFIMAKVRDRELSLADAKKWAQRELSQEILAKLGEVHHIDPSEIKDTFDNRKTYVYRKSYYGTGTFIVQKSSSSGGSSGSSIVDQLGEKMGLGKEAREKVKEAFGFNTAKKKSSSKAATPEEWWKGANTSTKTHWITAYYAENSGDIEIVRVDYQPCPECGGKGYKKYIAAGASKEGTKYTPCKRCQGLGKFRVVVYK